MPHDDRVKLALLEQQIRMHTEDCLFDRQAQEKRHTDLRNDFGAALTKLEGKFSSEVTGLRTKLESFDNKLWAIVVLVAIGVGASLIKEFLGGS